MKIAVYAICKDEVDQVEGWLRSVDRADYVCVTDTGSTDGTVEKFRNNYVGPSKIAVKPWSFGKALNCALATVPWDADICIRLDLDSRLSEGWYEVIRRAWITVPGTQQLWYNYQFSDNLTYHMNHVHARFGFSWEGDYHEGLYPAGKLSSFCSDFKITHKHQKKRPIILEGLKAQAAAAPTARNLFYLGREYFYLADERGIDVLKRYLKVGTFRVERMDACIMLGKLTADVAWFHKACAEYPTRESYAALASLVPGQAGEALSKFAMTFENRTDTIHQNPALWRDYE